jgi:hypothetical protein
MSLVTISAEGRWEILPFAIAIAAATLQKWWLSYQSHRSENWPVSYGRILSATNEVQEKTATLKAPYSYRVGDQSYGGTFKKAFADSDEAETWEKVLPGQQIAVRYDPNKPSRSRLQESDLQMIVRAFAPSETGRPLRSEDLTWWERSLCQLVLVVAVAGFAACLGELVSENLGRPLLSHGAYGLLIMGGLPLAMFSFWEGRRGGLRILRTLPGWMKYMGYIVLYYTILSALPFFPHPSGSQRMRENTRDTNYQLALYFGAVEVLYARLNSESQSPDYLQRSLDGRVKIG